jgi:hypothetical protein
VRFQQERADFARGLNHIDASSARQHTGFFGRTQVRKHPTPDVNAFANVERQSSIALKEIHPRGPWQGGQNGGIKRVVQARLACFGLVELEAAENTIGIVCVKS